MSQELLFRGQAKLRLTLIYSDTTEARLAIGRTGVRGEANCLRYITR